MWISEKLLTPVGQKGQRDERLTLEPCESTACEDRVTLQELSSLRDPDLAQDEGISGEKLSRISLSLLLLPFGSQQCLSWPNLGECCQYRSLGNEVHMGELQYAPRTEARAEDPSVKTNAKPLSLGTVKRESSNLTEHPRTKYL